MAKKIMNMNEQDLVRIIMATVYGGGSNDDREGLAAPRNQKRMAKVIQKLLGKAYQEGIEHGERFE